MATPTTSGPPSLEELPPMEVSSRLARLRERLEPTGIDGLLVTNLTNVRYLSGFTGSAGLLLVTSGDALLVTDGRYEEQSRAEVDAAGSDVRVSIGGTAADQQELLVDSASTGGLTRLGLEADHVTWSQLRRIEQEWFDDVVIVPAEGVVEELRLVKDDGEVARIEAACRIADTALATVRSRLAEGPTEAEFGLDLDTEMRRLGASELSFETIVAAGPNGARPHHRPGQRVLRDGDLVVVDFGAMVDGYHSDMTRTFQIGEVSSTQKRMWDVVRAAQQAGVDAVRAGRSTEEVDAACREPIAEAGWDEAFVHATGHGVGLDIHEQPRVGANGGATLQAGFVVTVEPGVYLPEHGGVRIEDTVVVAEGGCRVLTGAPKQPVP